MGEDGLRLQPDGSAFAWMSQRLAERVFLLNQYRRRRRVRHLRRPLRDRQALLDALRRKHLVFCVTAGRTGTTYVTRLGELFPDTVSLHEPQPSYVHFLRQAQRRPRLAYHFLLEYKLPFIASAPATHYVETSHLFAKGFLEPMLDLGLRPAVLLLRREPRAIARSLLTRRTVPGRGKLGFKYLVHPGDPGVLPLPHWNAYSDYQLCFWYALEMERRQRDYGALLSAHGCAVADATADELHDSHRFLAVAQELGLLDGRVDREALLQRHAEVSGRLYNYNRRPPAVVVDPDAAEEAVWQAVAPAAPWMREAVARRYAPAGEVTRRAASRS
ncbi:hypothetical protein KF840_07515 [bacterium]|nr:hypothetical protein [bacterium]